MDQRGAPPTTRLATDGRLSDAALMVSAVRDDVRQTLRDPWLHPGIEAAAAHPAFFAAAWSSIRPNVGRSFDRLAGELRAAAVRAVRDMETVRRLRDVLERSRSGREVRRMVQAAAAAQFAAVRNEVAIHLLTCAVRGEAVGGTGQEEPPGRRGVHDWQGLMSVSRPPGLSRVLLDQAERAMGVPSAPPALWLLSQCPDVLAETWAGLRPLVAGDAWQRSTVRLRWAVRGGVRRLPHEVSLQWHVLRRRGFSESDQAELCRILDAHDHAMAASTLTAAFVWLALGEPADR